MDHVKVGRTLGRGLTCGLLSLTAVTALGICATARAGAGDTPAVDPSSFSLATAVATPMTDEPQDGLLQTEMKNHGWGGDWLDSYGIRLTGYVDMGFNFNFARPPFGFNGPGRLFDQISDDPTFNQLSLMVSREAIASTDRFDTGFTVQMIYGSDARFTQANGTNFYGSSYAGNRSFTFIQDRFIASAAFPGQQRPDEQIDLLQAYLTFNLPIYNGVQLKAGKFVAPWGIEKIDPTQNAFYSHGLIFSLSFPMTLTGVTASTQINDKWGVMGGIVTGWNQSIEDNNDFPSFMGQASYKISDDMNAVLTLIVGPEEEGNRSDYRSLANLTFDYKVDTEWHVGAEAVYGYEPDVGTSYIRPNPQLAKFQSLTFKDASWNGIAAYVDYKFDPDGMFVGHGRGEIFNDGDGARLVATQIYSLTGGVTVKPFVHDNIGKNLAFRPELRWDYSDQPIFDGNSRTSQFTFAIDVLFNF